MQKIKDNLKIKVHKYKLIYYVIIIELIQFKDNQNLNINRLFNFNDFISHKISVLINIIYLFNCFLFLIRYI